MKIPVKKIQIKGKEYLAYPQVYPSDKFRSTNFVLENTPSLFKGATVCDMGCGMGIIGLFALQYGAKAVVQVDINPFAVENAKANIALYNFTTEQIKAIESNCFDNVPVQTFDVIIFNVPYNNEPCEIEDPLEYGIRDPLYASSRKFLFQAKKYCHSTTQIFLAFSSKGSIKEMEQVFDDSEFKWNLWKIANTNLEFHNRLYRFVSDHKLK